MKKRTPLIVSMFLLAPNMQVSAGNKDASQHLLLQ